ncbi:MAG: RimK family alpha-L-glutamate ligase [Thermoleophilia bacterium]
MQPRVAIATCAEHPDLDGEGNLLLDALRELGIAAEPAVWTALPEGGWDAYDLVVLRSTWDYTSMPERFLRWTQSIRAPLLNAPAVVAWNADKRYLLDLARAAIATIPTELVARDAAFAPPAGRFVLKPAIAAGSRGAALFDAARHEAAREHLAALQADGHDVLLQPYLDAVDGPEAETALVFIDGTLSHAMRKGPLLALDLPPPEGLFRQEQMSAREEPAADVVALGMRAHAHVEARFGRPLYARVDVLRDRAGLPAVLELELIEPSLFLDFAPNSAQALARAIAARLAA